MTRIAALLALGTALSYTTAAYAQNCVNGLCSVSPGPAFEHFTPSTRLRGAFCGSRTCQCTRCDGTCDGCQASPAASWRRSQFQPRWMSRYDAAPCPYRYQSDRTNRAPAETWPLPGQQRHQTPDARFNRYPDMRYPPMQRVRFDYNGLNDRPREQRYEPGPEVQRSIRWRTNLRSAANEVRASGRPMLINITADWCSYCTRMKNQTFRDAGFVAELNRSGFIPVRLDADTNRELVSRLGIRSLPTTLLVSPELKVQETLQGFQSADQLIRSMRRHGRSATGQVDMTVVQR